MNIDQLTEFFKWMTIINISLLLLSTLLVYLLRNFMYRIHSQIFNLSPEQIAIVAYSYLGMFKILVIVFNITPYVALLLAS